MERDFTYIDDVIEIIYRCCFKPAVPEDSRAQNSNDNIANVPHLIFNVGNGKPIKLLDFIKYLEESLDKKAILNFQPLQKGDVIRTSSDTSKINKWVGYKPKIDIQDGVIEFAKWYKNFYA